MKISGFPQDFSAIFNVEFYPDICFIKDHTLLHQFLQFKNGFGDIIGRGFRLRAIGLRQFMWIRTVLPAADKTGDSRDRNFYSLFGKPVLELFQGGTFFCTTCEKVLSGMESVYSEMAV